VAEPNRLAPLPPRWPINAGISSKIVRDYAEIYVGNLNASQLAKTKMAKSVLDAGWSMFRNVLQYKSIATGGMARIVSERRTTQVCSCCGWIPDSSPKGRGALGWVCSNCRAVHDRDINSALNILCVGLERQALVGEILALYGGEDV
jgi:putative transposase